MGEYERLPEETRFEIVQASCFVIEKAMLCGVEYCNEHKAEIMGEFKKWFSEMPKEEKKERFEMWKKTAGVDKGNGESL